MSEILLYVIKFIGAGAAVTGTIFLAGYMFNLPVIFRLDKICELLEDEFSIEYSYAPTKDEDEEQEE